MIVYVITKGCYSDYHICEVTTDKNKAEKLVRLYSDSYDNAKIEEYDTEEQHEELDRLIPVYCVRIESNGQFRVSIHNWHDSAKPFQPEFYFPDKSDPLMFIAKLTAKDEKYAAKIACDHRAKMIALAYGL